MKLTLQDNFPFGKWKGVKIDNIIPKDDDDLGNCFSIFGRGDGVSYMRWVERTCKNVELQNDILTRLRNIEKERSKNYTPEPSRRGSRLDHYNDMGGVVDISFQELYGDFGF